MEYYELCVSPASYDSIDARWMCIKAMREPTCEEATEFLRQADDLQCCCDRVIEVNPLTEREARENYCFENEAEWPIFGKEE